MDGSPYAIQKRVLIHLIRLHGPPALEHIALDELILLHTDFHGRLAIVKAFGDRNPEAILGLEIGIRASEGIRKIPLGGVVGPFSEDNSALAIGHIQPTAFERNQDGFPRDVEVSEENSLKSAYGVATHTLLVGTDTARKNGASHCRRHGCCIPDETDPSHTMHAFPLCARRFQLARNTLHFAGGRCRQ